MRYPKDIVLQYQSTHSTSGYELTLYNSKYTGIVRPQSSARAPARARVPHFGRVWSGGKVPQLYYWWLPLLLLLPYTSTWSFSTFCASSLSWIFTLQYLHQHPPDHPLLLSLRIGLSSCPLRVANLPPAKRRVLVSVVQSSFNLALTHTHTYAHTKSSSLSL